MSRAKDKPKQKRVKGQRKKLAGVCWGQPVLTATDRYDDDKSLAQDPSKFDVLHGAGLGALQDCQSALYARLGSRAALHCQPARADAFQGVLHISCAGCSCSCSCACCNADSAQQQPRESNRQKRLRAAVPLSQAPAATDEADPAARAHAQPASISKQRKLSTQIPLLPARAGSKQHGTRDNQQQAAASHAAPASSVQQQHGIMQSYMAKLHLSEPTEVQLRCWPIACAGHDVIAQV